MSLRRNLLLAKIVTNLSIKATVTVGRKLTLSVLNPIVKMKRLTQVPTTTSHHLTQIVEMIQIVVQSVKKITKDTVIAGKKPILNVKKMRKENLTSQTQNLRNLVTKKDTQVTVIPGKMLIQNV